VVASDSGVIEMIVFRPSRRFVRYLVRVSRWCSMTQIMP
jgi:hypothetical protein